MTSVNPQSHILRGATSLEGAVLSPRPARHDAREPDRFDAGAPKDPPPPTPTPTDGGMNTAELATWLGVSFARAAQFRGEGMPARKHPLNGVYVFDKAASVRWLLGRRMMPRTRAVGEKRAAELGSRVREKTEAERVAATTPVPTVPPVRERRPGGPETTSPVLSDRVVSGRAALAALRADRQRLDEAIATLDRIVAEWARA